MALFFFFFVLQNYNIFVIKSWAFRKMMKNFFLPEKNGSTLIYLIIFAAQITIHQSCTANPFANT